MASTDTKTDAKAAPATTGKLTFKLTTPVAFNGETYSEVPYRQAKGREMRRALNTPKSGDRYHALMVDLCELPEAFFDQISGPDYMALTDVMDGFFARTPATSTT